MKKTRRAKAVAEAPMPVAKPWRSSKKNAEMPASSGNGTSESAGADI